VLIEDGLLISAISSFAVFSVVWIKLEEISSALEFFVE